MPNPYEPDFEFPYNEGVPVTGPSSNSPINLNLGQVPEVDDPILSQTLLDVYNALEVLQTFQGNLTSATGTQIANLAALTARVALTESNLADVVNRVTSAETNIAANADAIGINAAAIAANSNNIGINASAITTNSNNVAANASAITVNANNIGINSNAIGINSNAITVNSNNITVNSNNIAANVNAITVNSNGIAANVNNIAANSNAILTKQSIEYESITVTADYTITLANRLIRADCTGGDITVTLPLASTFEDRRYTIKRIDTSDNTVTLVPTSSELIDGHCTSITIPSKAAIEVQAGVEVQTGVDYWDTISKR